MTDYGEDTPVGMADESLEADDVLEPEEDEGGSSFERMQDVVEKALLVPVGAALTAIDVLTSPKKRAKRVRRYEKRGREALAQVEQKLSKSGPGDSA